MKLWNFLLRQQQALTLVVALLFVCANSYAQGLYYPGSGGGGGGTLTPPVTITNTVTTAVPLTITGASGQSANLLNINTFGSTGGNALNLSSTANLIVAGSIASANSYISGNSIFGGASDQFAVSNLGALSYVGTNTGTVAEVLTGANGQTADLLDINSFGNTGGNLLNLTNAGQLSCPAFVSTSNSQFGSIVCVGDMHGGANVYSSAGGTSGTNSNPWSRTYTAATTITTGSNATAGTGTLSGGTVNIATTAVTANSLIFVQPTSAGTTAGRLTVTSKTAGTGFTVTSITPGAATTLTTDVSTFNWWFINFFRMFDFANCLN